VGQGIGLDDSGMIGTAFFFFLAQTGPSDDGQWLTARKYG
jgi:hypothetical protein